MLVLNSNSHLSSCHSPFPRREFATLQLHSPTWSRSLVNGAHLLFGLLAANFDVHGTETTEQHIPLFARLVVVGEATPSWPGVRGPGLKKTLQHLPARKLYLPRDCSPWSGRINLRSRRPAPP